MWKYQPVTKGIETIQAHERSVLRDRWKYQPVTKGIETSFAALRAVSSVTGVEIPRAPAKVFLLFTGLW